MYTMYPRPAIYLVNLESGLVTEYDLLPMGHFMPSLWPLQVETVVVRSQQGLPCGSIGSQGQEPVVDGFPANPHSIQIPDLCSQGPNVY